MIFLTYFILIKLAYSGFNFENKKIYCNHIQIGKFNLLIRGKLLLLVLNRVFLIYFMLVKLVNSDLEFKNNKIYNNMWKID